VLCRRGIDGPVFAKLHPVDFDRIGNVHARKKLDENVEIKHNEQRLY
jgi:hypothetical protein